MASVLAFAPARSPVRRPALRSETPQLSVIVVNYCQWGNTARLVRQLRGTSCMRRGAVEVVVVDNHSPPDPLARRLRRWPGVSLRRWGRNRGFAQAVNEGCRLGQGEWFLLLNPDMSVTPEFVQGVLDLADDLTRSEPRAGIVGFQLHNSDGSPQLSAGVFPTLAGTLAGLFMPRHRRKYQDVTASERCPVPWVTGCCLLVRRDCLEALGGLDRRFFLYYEDVDLCRRARAHGWSVWYEPRLHAVHQHPLHGREVPPALRVLTRHSLLTYSRRHWPTWQFRLLAGIVRMEAWARGLWAWCRGNRKAAALFQDLGWLACDLAHGRLRSARKRLARAVQLV